MVFLRNILRPILHNDQTRRRDPTPPRHNRQNPHLDHLGDPSPRRSLRRRLHPHPPLPMHPDQLLLDLDRLPLSRQRRALPLPRHANRPDLRARSRQLGVRLDVRPPTLPDRQGPQHEPPHQARHLPRARAG